jgi:tight adherence protein C
MDDTTLFSLCGFGFVALVAYGLMNFLGSSDTQKLRARLRKNEAAAPEGKRAEKTSFIVRFGQAVSRPFMPTKGEKISTARRNLGHAGIYAPLAVKTLYGFKFIFLVVGLVGGYVAGVLSDMPMLCLPLGALAGFYAPVIWLKQMIKSNQKKLDYGLADALDLMVVCVEAGLTMDAAMQRVGQEMAMVHPALSRELGITHMETRIGLSRGEALKNLGSRTGSPALQSLSAMLLQAERFGTSIAQALRVHAESLRLNRQFKAEEMAAKTSVKMSFPLVLFIFPATFIILMGPTVLQLLDSPLFK